MEFEAYARVLVVEDDPDTSSVIKSALEGAGFDVHQANRGDIGLESMRNDRPDLVVLDVNLPGMDGLSICREARKFYDGPILFLSAKDDAFDKILGLEIGADDYLTKPFEPRELVARLRALQRRMVRSTANTSSGSESAADEIRLGTVCVNLAAHTVTVAGSPVHLTPIEFSLLSVLVRGAGRVQTRQNLLDDVWGMDHYGDERVVDVHIRHLRKKLQEFEPQDLILAVRGVGYKFETN